MIETPLELATLYDIERELHARPNEKPFLLIYQDGAKTRFTYSLTMNVFDSLRFALWYQDVASQYIEYECKQGNDNKPDDNSGNDQYPL